MAYRWQEPLLASVPVLTLGRLALLSSGAALALAAIARGNPRRTLSETLTGVSRSGAVFMLALAGEGAMIAVSIVVHGQNTAGAFYGFLELTLAAGLTLALAQARPRFVGVLLGCAALGGLIGSGDALAGKDPLAVLTGGHGRLAGRYGNPNFLGFAAATAVAIFLALALLRRRPWPLWLAGGALTGMAMLLSYSRGAILAAGTGIVVAVALSRSGARRRLQTGVLGCALFAAAGAAAYPLYQRLRTNADFAQAASAPKSDRSGWNPNATGLIGSGPALLANASAPAGKEVSLLIRARRPGEGASLPLGYVPVGTRCRLTLRLSSPTLGLPVDYAMEDNLLGAGPASAIVLLRPRPHLLRLEWTPTRDAANARVYLWLPDGGIAIVSRLGFAATGRRVRQLPLRLLGLRIPSVFSESEAHFVHSREDAASLALRLFGEHPLTGVGWQRFTTYSAARLHYGALATHDEYLRYAAELGLPGILLLVLATAALLRGVADVRPDEVRVAAAAALATGAVGLLFVNALEVPAIALALSVSAAALIARPRTDYHAGRARP